MSGPTRILVLGIDAASPPLLRAWAADGTLPNLRGLMERGTTGETRGVEGFFVGSTWPSFYTGLTPARHGLHYLVQLVPGTYRLHRSADEGLVAGAPFWTRLAQAGRRVAVLDVPLSPPDTVPDGIQVVEWGSHDSVFGFRTSPASLAGRITDRFGEPPRRTPCDEVARSPAGYGAFVEELVEGVHRKTDLTRELLRQGGWDLFLQVFTEAHCAGHQCWHLHDPDHPAHDPALAGALGDPLRRVYRAIDAAIGDLVEEAGDALVLVVVPHGMGHWYGAQFLLPEVLVRLGLYERTGASKGSRPEDDAPSTGLRDRVRGAAVAGARRAWRALPDDFRRLLQPIRDRIRGDREPSTELPVLDVDPDRSLCFPHPNGLAVGGIRLNLAGREPAGIVEPSRADEVCRRIRRELLRIEDADTGRPAVRAVTRTAELYAGERLDHLPDVLVHWSDERPVGSAQLADGRGARVRLRSPGIGVVEGVNRYGRTGEHRQGGMYVAAGPGVRSGASRHGPVSLLDYAPTLARLLDVEAPGFEGRVLEGIG